MEELVAEIPSVKNGRRNLVGVLPAGRTAEECLAIAKELGCDVGLPSSLVLGTYVKRDGIIVGNDLDSEVVVKVLIHEEEPREDGAIHLWDEIWVLAPLEKRRSPVGTKYLYVIPEYWGPEQIEKLMLTSGRFVPMEKEQREELAKKQARAC